MILNLFYTISIRSAGEEEKSSAPIIVIYVMIRISPKTPTIIIKS